MNILEKLKAAGISLNDLKTVAPSLTHADRTELIKALSAEAAKKSPRMEQLQASKERQTNLKMEFVKGELARLGMPLGDIKASAAKKFAVHELDAAMKSRGWNTVRRMAFKTDLNSLGMLD